ncbi:MAG: hypothetical protein GC191_07435 [Azospirillum sp.]|nr:hypothetical protein [Azospirillum sp.]
MSRLTPEGQMALGEICRRHGVSEDAGLMVLEALARNSGTMAQFNHPELGGSGQWMAGGMVMVGDMFNQGLKARVDGICYDLAGLLGSSPFRPAPSPPGVSVFVAGGGGSGGQWWPAELGSPNWQGSQNNLRYAFFAFANRLVLDIAGDVAVYDTSGFTLTGVGQQQSSSTGASLSFTGPGGIVTLDRLRRIDGRRAGADSSEPSPAPATAVAPATPTPAPAAAESAADRRREAPPGQPVTEPPAIEPPPGAAAVDPGQTIGDHLAGTRWLYAPPEGAVVATVTLGAEGVLLGGGAALSYWAVENAQLWFYGADGRATARFDRITGEGQGARIVGTSPPESTAVVVLRTESQSRPAVAAAATKARPTLELRLELCDRDWRFGENGGGTIATLRLLPDGTLSGSARPAESAWRLDGEVLVFLHKSGRPTTRFTKLILDDGRWCLSGRYLANDRILHELQQV